MLPIIPGQIPASCQQLSNALPFAHHIETKRMNIAKVWNLLLRVYVCQHKERLGLTDADIEDIDAAIRLNNLTLFSEEEFPGLLQYYMPEPNCPKDIIAWRKAELHHYHMNPHHWQHWVLTPSSLNNFGIPMPKAAVLEMLCDWGSGPFDSSDQTAHSIYHHEKAAMILHPSTHDFIVEVLNCCPGI